MLALIYFFILFQAICLALDYNRQFILHPTPISDINLKELSSSVGLMLCVQEDEKYAYITSAQNGVHIVDLSKIYIPKIISRIPSGYAQHCEVKNDYLFIADQVEGLVIADVKDKKNPKRIAQIAYQKIPGLQRAYQYVTLSPDFKYAFTLSFGFVFTYDISDIYNPQFAFVVAAQNLFAPNSYRLKFDSNYEYIAVANHLSGVTIIDIRNKHDQKLRMLQNPSFVTWDCLFSPDRTAFFAIDIYFGVFYLDPSPIFKINQQDSDLFSSANPLTFKQIIPPTDSYFMTITMTSDGTHLITGHRSTGLKLYKFQYDTVNNKFNYESPIFIQHLNGNYMALSIVASSKNEKYIYVANGITFTIYQSVSPNINQDFPNFFNTFQSSLIYQTPELTRSGLLCQNNNIVVTNPQSDIRIYNIADPYYPQLLSSIPKVDIANGNVFDQISIVEGTEDEKTIYVQTATTGVITIDISDKSDPKIKDKFLYYNKQGDKNTQVTYSLLSPDKNNLIVSNSFYGVVLLKDVKTKPLSQASQQVYSQNLACGIEKCIFTSDGLKLICACREVGTLFFTIGTEENFTWQYLFNEIGCEGVAISKNDKLLFIANGFQGLFILDVSNFSTPKQLSQLVLQGWAQTVYLLFDEKYIVVAETDKGQLSLVNIEDPLNPYVQQRIQFQRESATNICLIPNTNEMFFVGNAGLRYQPILPNVKIHSQFQLKVSDNDGDYYLTLADGENLLVGQYIRATFVPLYTEQNIKIKDVKYYRYFEKQSLPTWITFLPSNGQIFISVNKLGAFNDFSTEKKGENILILEVYIEVKSTDLIRDKLIDSVLAAQIISLLQSKGYLDYNGYVTDLFDPSVPLGIDFSNNSLENTEIQKVVKKVLTFSRVDYPIRFFIVSSLVFNYKSTQRLLASSGDVISTPSQQVSIFMQIQQNGKFVKKIFEGVLASFSDDLTSVKISGQTSYVNNIMKKSIQISNSTVDLSQVKIQFLLSDSNNYDQTIDTTLKEVGFTQIYQPVQLNKDLQSQFNRYYSNGNLFIEERFQFTFDSNTFVQKDGLAITYKAYFLNGDDEPQEILTGDWIEFSSVSLGMSGLRTGSYFLDSYWIRVVATDGYSKAHDDFTMTFNQVPFFYAFQLIISVIGPLLGLLGLWKYRYEIHLFVAERKNMYRNEIAVIGKVFKKQIILFGSVQADAINLWKELQKQNKDLEKELTTEYKVRNTIDIYHLMSKLEQIYQLNASKYPLLDPREFDFDDSRMVRCIKRLAYQSILEDNQPTYQAHNILKNFAMKTYGKKDWYKTYLKINPIMQIINNEVIRQEATKEVKEVEAKEVVELQKSQSQIKLIESNQVRLREQSQPQNIKLTEDVSTPQTDRMGDKSLKYLTNNINQQILKDLQQPKNQGEIGYIQLYTNLNAFPEIQINQQHITDILLQQGFNQVYDMSLLAEVIALEASGTLLSSPSGINPSSGESIHAFPHDLYTLQAFRRGKNQNFVTKIMDFLNMNYSSIGFVKNNPLPKWLNYSIIDGIIHIWGVPQPCDEAEILIRIINNTGFAIHSFHIFTKDFQGNDMRDKVLVRKATLHYKPSSRNSQQCKLHSSVNILSQDNRIQSPQFKQQSSEPAFDSPITRNNSQQNITSKSQFAIDLNNKLQNPMSNLLNVNLNRIDEEKPEHLREYASNITQQKDLNKKASLEIESSIIIEMENSIENKGKMGVKVQGFKNKPQ